MKSAWLAIPLLLAAGEQEAPDTFKGPWKPVTLELKDVDAREAVEEARRQAGVVLELPQRVAEKKITLSLKEVPFWRAFDEICRLHGDLRLGASSRAGLVEAKPWVERPLFYQGPLRFMIFDAARVRELRYPDRRDRTDLTISLRWTSDFLPVRSRMGLAGDLRLTRVEDDTGRSLLPPLEGENTFDHSLHGSPAAAASEWLLRLQPSAPKARRIARVEGEWEGAFLSDVEEVRFDKPLESVGTSRKVGPMTVTLQEFKPEKDGFRSGDSFEVRLRVSFDPSTAPEAWKEGLKQVPLGSRMLPMARSEANDSIYLSEVKGKEANAVELRGSVWGRGREPASIVLRVGKGVGAARGAFAFKDVALPEDDR